MKLTKKQKILLTIMIIIIGLIIYNMYFIKNEHASSIPVDQKLELVKTANNIKNIIISNDTKNLNNLTIFLLASNVINQIQYLFFIYNNNLGIVKVNLSTGRIETSKHVSITKEPTKVLFKTNGDFVITNINDNKNLYATNTVNKKFDSLSLKFDGVKSIYSSYLLFQNSATNEQVTFFIDRFLDDINIYLGAEIIENDLPIQVKTKIENYLFEYSDKPQISSSMSAPMSTPMSTPVSSPMSTPVSSPMSTPVSSPVSSPMSTPMSTPVSSPMSTPMSTQNMMYNINCNIDFANTQSPSIKSCSLIKY